MKNTLLPAGLAGSLLLPLMAAAQPVSEEANNEFVIGLMSIFVGWGVVLVICIVGLSLFAPVFAQRKQHQLIEKFLESGQEIPQELLGKPETPKPVQLAPAQLRARSMRRGVVLLALGIGIGAVAFAGSGEPRAAAWGLLFLGLAVASFVNARFFSGSA